MTATRDELKILSELYDVLGAAGLDLAGAVQQKLDYNRTRAHRHGGKLA